MKCPFCNNKLSEQCDSAFNIFTCITENCRLYSSYYDAADGMLYEERIRFIPDFVLVKNHDPLMKDFYIKILRKIKSATGRVRHIGSRIIRIPEFEIINDHQKMREKIEIMVIFL